MPYLWHALHNGSPNIKSLFSFNSVVNFFIYDLECPRAFYMNNLFLSSHSVLHIPLNFRIFSTEW